MMIDCSNIDVREALPEFLHGTLGDASHERVQAHLDLCAACTAELLVLRAVLAAAASPRVDTARITAALPPYRRRRRLDTVYMRLAAAFLVVAAGVSAIAVTHEQHSGTVSVSNSQETSTSSTSPGVAIVGVSELSDDHLEQLISDMDQLEALPPADPEPVSPADADVGA